ncbi:MAG: tRNA (adenosine(37)-N6)-threonylcarbamoyltransferase complex transferase subunit TsaD [bacterium]
MRILSIETSCDETSASVVEGNRGMVKILSNIISSQIDIHKKYGGVVPEVAARNHILNIVPVIDEALMAADTDLLPSASFPDKGRHRKGAIDLIAVTGGPGLMSSLLIGAQTAETLAYAWRKPLLVVNHIEGHIYANWLKQVCVYPNPKSQISKPEFPALALIVSGGHTQLVLMRDHLKYKTIGKTRDDAAGEAFDKVAKILGLGYPGGPIISRIAGEYNRMAVREKMEMAQHFYENKIKLPRPMIDSDNFDFSFSGLKTAVLYMVRKIESEVSMLETDKHKPRLQKDVIPAICAEFQQAVTDVLVHKTIKAAKKYKVISVLLAGGVAANNELRTQLEEAVVKELSDNIIFSVPEQKLCTDNAAMVGAAAYYRYEKNPKSAKMAQVGMKINPNWEL